MKHLIAPFLLSLICSSSLFASGRPTLPSFGDSTNPMPSFDGGAVRTIPSFGGTRNPKPGTNPVVIDPDGNPVLKLPKLKNPVLSNLLKGIGGDPMTAAQVAIITGDYYSADRQCLKAAQDTPQGRPSGHRKLLQRRSIKVCGC